MRLDAEYEQLLGRAIPPEAAKSVATLNDLPPEMVAEARLLAKTKSRLYAVRYLQYHVQVFHLGWGADFIDDVVLGGEDAATWGIADRICTVHRSRAGLASLSVALVAEKLGAVAGERWWREAPLREAWDRDLEVGAPGVVIRSARYWVEGKLPDGTRAPLVELPLEPIAPAGLPVAVRRWLASRFAREARAYLEAGRPSLEGLVTALSLPRDALGEDALVAARALVREASALPPSSSAVPGFRGPDAWYAEASEVR